MFRIDIIINLIFATAFIACNTEFAFKSDKEDSANQISETNDASQSASSDIINLDLQLNHQQTPIDYLLVIDNSTSMDGIISRIQQGILIAAEENLFPENSRLASMSTMVGNIENLSQSGPGINIYPGIEFEPGFLKLIHRRSIDLYLEQAPQFANRWPIQGCESEWFEPTAKNSLGDYCLTAALQTSGARIGAEAGILAFYQLLQINAERQQKLFRTDALVNVIFVSDTHDPGRPDPLLLELRPSFEAVNELIAKHFDIKQLQFHALAPDQTCTTEELFDKSYYQLAAKSGGQTQDPCVTEDYKPFIASMIKASQRMKKNVALDPPALEILGIRLDGRLSSEFQLQDDGRSVDIYLEAETPVQNLTIIYRRSPVIQTAAR